MMSTARDGYNEEVAVCRLLRPTSDEVALGATVAPVKTHRSCKAIGARMVRTRLPASLSASASRLTPDMNYAPPLSTGVRPDGCLFPLVEFSR
jgi:hypothetical protein